MATFLNRIDVHHHLVPPAFASAMAANGLREVAGAPLPGSWTPEKSIELMDMYGIATAIVSLPAAVAVAFGDGGPARDAAADLARACNEFAADMAARHPGRFGSFAVLPMPFTDKACREAAHGLDVLDADGVILLGSCSDGSFLGDARFDELMAELDRREAIVFLHPNLHKSSTGLRLSAPGFLVEFPCDTTRAATNLILSGTTEKYPRIRWVLAHAGGFLPYIAWRLSLANDLPHLAFKVPHGVLSHIRRFYYDTALSVSPYALAALRELVEPDHILFGSDYPFAPAVVTGLETAALERLTIFDEATKQGINRGHALALLPQYASATYGDADVPLSTRIRRAVAKPVVTLAETVRNR